jgi:hypothetical protein
MYTIGNDICNLNLTNRLIRKCKSLGKEQRQRYIELGKMCQECTNDDSDEEESTEEEKKSAENIVVIKSSKKSNKKQNS